MTNGSMARFAAFTLALVTIFVLLVRFAPTTSAVGGTLSVENVGHLGGWVNTAAVQGNYAYLGQGQTVTVVDASTSLPTQAASLGFPGEPGIVLPNGDITYVAYAFGDLVNVVEQVDISNPLNPTRTSSSTIGQAGKTIYGMDLTGSHMVVAQEGSNGFKVVDNSSTSSLSVVGTLPLIALDVFATGTHAYVVTGEFFGGESNELVVVDISNPTSPS